MRDADRSILVRRIAARLFAKVEGGADRDEVLQAHGLYSDKVGDDEWVPSNRYATIEEHVSEAEDTALIESFDRLYGVVWAECPEPWTPGRVRLFGSHSSIDKVLVGEVRRLLGVRGIDLFVAHDVIDPTAEWLTVIESALATCEAMSAFLTPNFHASWWTDHEVGIAYGRGVPILPQMLGQPPYGFIGKYQGLKEQSPSEIADEIFTVLLRASWPMIATALLNQLEEAGSFDEANNTILEMRKLTRFPAPLADSLRYAKHYNNQVEGAWRVASGVQAVLQLATAT